MPVAGVLEEVEQAAGAVESAVGKSRGAALPNPPSFLSKPNRGPLGIAGGIFGGAFGILATLTQFSGIGQIFGLVSQAKLEKRTAPPEGKIRNALFTWFRWIPQVKLDDQTTPPEGKVRHTLFKTAQVLKLPNTAFKDFPQAAEEAFGARMGPRVAATAGNFGQFAQNMTKGHHRVSETLSNLSIGKTVLAASSVIGSFMAAKSIGKKIAMLQHMEHEITGRHVSKWQVITGRNLSPIVKCARTEAFGVAALGNLALQLGMAGFTLFGIFAPGKVPDATSDAGSKKKFNIRSLAAGSGMMALNFAPQMAGSILQEATKHHMILAGYEMAHAFQAVGKPVPAQAYGAIFRGLLPGTSDGDIARMAEQYCENPMSIPEFLKTLSLKIDPHYAVGEHTRKYKRRAERNTQTQTLAIS
jgi:hypothetical protein